MASLPRNTVCSVCTPTPPPPRAMGSRRALSLGFGCVNVQPSQHRVLERQCFLWCVAFVPLSETSCPRAQGPVSGCPLCSPDPSPHPSLTVQMTAAYYSYVELWVPSAHVCIPPNAAPSGGEGTSLWPPTTSAPPWHSTPGTKVKVGPPSGEGARRSEGPHLYRLRLPPLSPRRACGFLGA